MYKRSQFKDCRPSVQEEALVIFDLQLLATLNKYMITIFSHFVSGYMCCFVLSFNKWCWTAYSSG